MATYHVFIERAREPGARGEQALAAAVAERYGLPADQIAARLAAGRMRVKTNVDRATADTFAADLERLGAVCAVVDAATGETVARASVAPPAAPARAATPAPAMASALPPRTTPAPAPTSALPPRATPAPATTSALPPRAPTPAPTPAPTGAAFDAPPTRPSGAFSSGLSAAFTGDASGGAADLGALSSGEFALSALDGTDDAGPGASDAGLPASFGPPAPSDAGLPASFGPAAPAAGGPAQAPIDLFAPPDAESEPELDVAVDVRAERRAAATAPPLTHAASAARPGPLASAMADPATPAPVVQRGGALAQWIADARVRLAAGVVVAILVGFLPAHVVASMREGSAFAEVDRELARAQSKQQVVTIEHWNELDATRAKALARKEDKQRDIALASMLLWALVGAGVAYVWFRVIDWDRLGARLGA